MSCPVLEAPASANPDAFATEAAPLSSERVSAQSEWIDAVWVLDHPPHVSKGGATISWRWFLDHPTGEHETLDIALTESGRQFAWYLLHHRLDGPVAANTLATRVRIVSHLVRFLRRERDCYRLAEATLADIEAFIENRIEQLDPDGEGVGHGSITNIYLAITDLREARKFMEQAGVDALSFDPWGTQSPGALVDRHKTREKEYVHAVPEPAGRMVIDEACKCLDNVTPLVASLLSEYLRAWSTDAFPNFSKQDRSNISSEALRAKIRALSSSAPISNPEAKDLSESLIASVDELRAPQRILGRTVSNLVGAALIVIQALTGARQAEVKQLTLDCVQREVSMDGRWYFYFLRINRTKNDDGWISIFAGKCSTATPPPDHDDLNLLHHPDRSRLPLPVLAVAAMNMLRNPARELGILPKGSASPLFPNDHAAHAGNFRKGLLDSSSINNKQRGFVDDRPTLVQVLQDAYSSLADLLELAEVPTHFSSHSWRKWFTEAVISYEQRDDDYPALQRHLGHVVHSLITREHYASGGIEFRRLGENVLQERAARAMLRIIEGRGAATGVLARSLLADQELILKRLTSRSIEKRVRELRRFLEEQRITIVAAGNNSGICAYNPDHAKCWNSISSGNSSAEHNEPVFPGRDWIGEVGTAPLGPNRALARASLCRRCANFMLTEDHIEYWLDAASELSQLADQLEGNPNATQSDYYEAHAHRANALDYTAFVDNTVRRMHAVKP